MGNFIYRISKSSDAKSLLLLTFLALSTVFLVISCQLGAVTGIFASPGDHYQQGLQATQQGDWDTARKEFDSAKDYQDARQRALDAQQKFATVSAAYDRATKAINEQDWWTAYSQLGIVLKLSPSYNDASQKILQAQQQLDGFVKDAEQKLDTGDLEGAMASYKRAGGYKGANQKASQLDNTRANLDQLYGQMTASAAAGQWDSALQLNNQILSQVPNYRDVKAKRALYLEQVYALASNALSQSNYREAVRLFSILVAVEKNYKDSNEMLGQAQLVLKKAPSGTYPLNRILNQGSFTVTLTEIIVQADGRLRVNVTWRNNSSSSRTLYCPNSSDDDGRAFLTFADSTRSFPIETYCTTRRGESKDYLPGETFIEWAIYPPLPDATKPFSVTWYSQGTATGIVLVPIQ